MARSGSSTKPKRRARASQIKARSLSCSAFNPRTASDAAPSIATSRWRAHSVGVFQSLQTQILSKYSLYALYDVVPVYGQTDSCCLTTTVGAGGAAAGTTVAGDCPVFPPAGSCDVGGAPAEVTTLAIDAAFVSTIGGALDKEAPRLTNVDRVSVPKATTGTGAATLLGGADIMLLGSMGTLQVGITPVYKGGASGRRHGLCYIPLSIRRQTGGQARHNIKWLSTYRWMYLLGTHNWAGHWQRGGNNLRPSRDYQSALTTR